MEQDGVGDTEVDVNHLSDNELTERLRQLGANIGPITDTTREVYRRKLQRWLHYGPPSNTNTSESSQSEPHVDVAARSRMAIAEDENSTQNSHGNHIVVSPANSPTACDTPSINPGGKVSADTAAVGPHPKYDFLPPIRMSKSDVIPQLRPYSMSFAECGSGSFDETDDGWSDTDWLMKQKFLKPKAKSVAADEPVPTTNDTEGVDRVIDAESVASRDDEVAVRKRFSITPGPSLHEYRDGRDGSSCSPDLEEYRSMLPNSHQLAPPASNRPRRYCDTNKLLWSLAISMLLVLIIWAVVYNMEPPYINPMMML